MEVNRDTINRIVDLAEPVTVEIAGRTYTTKDLKLVKEPFNEFPLRPIPRAKTVTSLDALAALISREATTLYPDSNLFISCSAYDKVTVYTDVFTDRWERQELYVAECVDAPGWRDSWMDYERALIALQSQFVPNNGVKYLLDLLGRIVNKADVQTNDNGVTQSTEVRTGIALVGKETVEPIVPLRPYRTFQEIEQPESKFLVRIREGKGQSGNEIGLLEADGGMWKMDARKTIRIYLEEQLYSLGEKIVLTL